MAVVPRFRLVLRFGERRRSRLSPFVVISVAGHVVVTTGLLLLPTMIGRSQAPPDALVVDLVAPAATRAAAAPAPPAPSAAETTPAEGVRAATAEPKPAKQPEAKPEKKPEKKKPEKEPAKAPPTAPAAASESAAAGPQGPSRPVPDAAATKGGGGSSSSITAMEGGDPELAWYRDLVTSALYGRWFKPILEETGQDYEVSVTFDIARDGTVQNVRIEQASGIPSLDRSALRAVADAAPFPPLPPTWTKPQLSARFLFRLHPE